MANIGIFVGTVYGNAQFIAEEAIPLLSAKGHQVYLYDQPTWHQWSDSKLETHLIITSTTGQGDLPENIRPLYYDMESKGGYQPTVRYALIALGDSSYPDFCQAGKIFDTLLQSQQAQRILDVLWIDGSEVAEPECVARPWIQQNLG